MKFSTKSQNLNILNKLSLKKSIIPYQQPDEILKPESFKPDTFNNINRESTLKEG
mgnify:CR=1 FL=1